MKKIVKVFASVLACVSLILTVTSCAGGISEVKTTYKGSVDAVVYGEGTENGVKKTIEYSFSNVKLDYIETPRGDSIVVSYTKNMKQTQTNASDYKSSSDSKEFYTLYKDSDGLFIDAYVPVVETTEITTNGTTNTQYDWTYGYKKIRVKKDGKELSFTIPETFQIKYNENHYSSYNWFDDDVVDLKFKFTED